MELRYTLEILTKDIQDIEKLVGNLQNSDGSPSIELDLALSKLRNVYEVLTMIKADKLHELAASMGRDADSTPAAESRPLAEEEKRVAGEPVKAVSEEPEKAVSEEPEKPVSEEPEKPVSEEPEKPVSEEPEKPVSEEPEKPVSEEPEKPVKKEAKKILAEQFAAESSINDNLGGKVPGTKDARLIGQPIESIHRNIGINDRFLIIRELFGGDADSFMELIHRLDEVGDFEKAAELLMKRFPEDHEHEGFVILTGLIKRRYTTA